MSPLWGPKLDRSTPVRQVPKGEGDCEMLGLPALAPLAPGPSFEAIAPGVKRQWNLSAEDALELLSCT